MTLSTPSGNTRDPVGRVPRGGRGHGCQWSRRKDEAIAALLSQRNFEEAARAASISVPTLRRWLKISAFEAAYREARNAVVDQAMARLQKASVVAVAVLLNIMSDSEAPDGARLKAAGLVLRHRKGNRSTPVSEVQEGVMKCLVPSRESMRTMFLLAILRQWFFSGIHSRLKGCHQLLDLLVAFADPRSHWDRG